MNALRFFEPALIHVENSEIEPGHARVTQRQRREEVAFGRIEVALFLRDNTECPVPQGVIGLLLEASLQARGRLSELVQLEEGPTPVPVQSERALRRGTSSKTAIAAAHCSARMSC